MKIFYTSVVIALVLGLCLATYSLDNKDVATEIEAVLMENFKANESEDLDAALATIHTQAPIYTSTKQASNSLFETYDLKYDLLSFSYVGQDGKYAITRIKQTTTKVSGPAFRNNDLDAIHVFRKENGKWKFWTTAILEVKYTSQRA